MWCDDLNNRLVCKLFKMFRRAQDLGHTQYLGNKILMFNRLLENVALTRSKSECIFESWDKIMFKVVNLLYKTIHLNIIKKGSMIS